VKWEQYKLLGRYTLTQQRISCKRPLLGVKVITMANKETTSTNTGNGDEGYKGLDSEIKKDRREPLAIQGVDNLSDTELLEMLVSPGYNGKKAAEIAADLLHTFDKNLKEVFTATIYQLTQVKGIDFEKACKIKAAFELWKRAIAYCEDPVIKSPVDVIRLLAPQMMFLKQEEFRVLLLDSKRRLIRHCRVSLGSLDAALVEPRDVFRPAITEGAALIVVAHNHPSGNPEPSEQDIMLTRELSMCGMMLGIDVLDHVIIGFQDHVSFKDKGLM
jgi:DNA repair protein RadC